MTTITMTRFTRLPGGYRRHDISEFNNGPDFAFLLNQVFDMMRESKSKEPEAISFSKFNAGKMSGESWRSGSAIILEYEVGADELSRFEEIRAAAERIDWAHYLMSTATRHGQRTITLVYPLQEHVTAADYSRIASVLAAKLDLYDAASGILAHTHLIHIHPDSAVAYHRAPVINPKWFIRATKDEAQTIDPLQFERPRPKVTAAEVQARKPVNTAAEDGLFEW